MQMQSISPKIVALRRITRLTAQYEAENSFSMHPVSEKEWERILEAAYDDAADCGATPSEIDEAGCEA